MTHSKKTGWRHLHLTLVSVILILIIIIVGETAVRSNIQRDKDEWKAYTPQASTPFGQASSAQNGVGQSKAPHTTKKQKTENQKPQADSQASKDLKAGRSASPQKKKQQAIFLLEGILATAHRIEPVEYSILTQVEAATLLWQFDKPRATSILQTAVTAMRQLLEEEKQSDPPHPAIDKRRQRLRFQVLRKIAALNPDFLKVLSPNDKPETPISGEWTEEARAIMSVASDHIEEDPKIAARLAEQSMSFGYVDWQSFLRELGKRDNSEAERLAVVLISRLRDSSVGSVVLINLRDFVFAPGRSTGFREYFFRSLAVKLRRDLQPGTPVDYLTGDLYVAREMSQLTAAYPSWQIEFQDIAYALEMLFNERSLPMPGAPRRRMLDVSSLLPATSGDTQEIAKAIAGIGAMKDAKTRDKEYQKLAVQAAHNADAVLAEGILSKIEDENVQRETALMVYSPLARKAMAESHWTQAQKYALNISDPLGRTLMLDSIAQAMSQAGEDKLFVKAVYTTAGARLEREEPTAKAAKGFLILARSLHPVDPKESLEAIKSSVWVLNKLADKEALLRESEIESAIAAWIPLPNHSLKADEVIDLADMVGNAFREIARRDADNALSIAAGLYHRGLYSLAHLAIIRVLLTEANSSSDVVHRKRTAR